MQGRTSIVEELFAQALDLPSGTSRIQFLDQRCGGDAQLRKEVDSLLLAHEQAGTFLQTNGHVAGAHGGVNAAGDTNTHAGAAMLAGAFLKQAGDQNLSEYLAGLPRDVQQETRERIEAGLNVRRQTASAAEPADAKSPDAWPNLPGYRILHPLGEGGSGRVFLAQDEKLNRRVAIKTLRRSHAEVRQRLLDEARKAAALNDPAIITIYAVLDEVDPPAIVMEQVEGYPIDRFAEQLSFEQKARLLREVARGLAAAHQHGVIHRDLKPDNILVGPDMRPRILDFGLALSPEEAGRRPRGFEGTPLYASPEQARGKPLGLPSDIFAFGCVMFKVLTDRPPFEGRTLAEVLEAIATTAPPMLREVAVGIPEDLQAICLACLAWEPADRPTAATVAMELGRYLVGEPVRLRPKLYDDLLRRSLSEYSHQASAWQSQSIISHEERDSFEVLHRRLLSEEDHWIIDARRITPLQTILTLGTWLGVVAIALTVWLLRTELGAPWRWLFPALCTLTLLGAGALARRSRDALASATFLAGAVLAIAPATLALLGESKILAVPTPGVRQLFENNFSNQQALLSSLTALALSAFGWRRLKMTGFAWTTAALGLTSYLGCLLLFNWLDKKPEVQALWCLPLMLVETWALRLERLGRVRWTLPYHLIALLALVVGLDVIAWNGPALEMLGINQQRWAYLDHERLQTLSVAANGLLFLALAVLTEHAASLDLRRGSKLLEILAILHTLSVLFGNAMSHRGKDYVRADVGIYIAMAVLYLVLAPFRSRWRMLAGGLAGCGLGSYLIIDLVLQERSWFVLSLGGLGLALALGTFFYVHNSARLRRSIFRRT